MSVNSHLGNHNGNLESYIQNIRRLVCAPKAKGPDMPINFIAALKLNNLTKEYDYIVTVITQNICHTNKTNTDKICGELQDESRRIQSNRNQPNRQKESKMEMSLAINERHIEFASHLAFSPGFNPFKKSRRRLFSR